jgi:hypothetical protein
MPALRGRKAKSAEEELQRLNEQSEKGEDAARRFAEAARKVMAVPKAVVAAADARARRKGK